MNVSINMFLSGMLFILFVLENNLQNKINNTRSTPRLKKEISKNLKFSCAISNGMKADSLFFEVSPDRKKLMNLYFKGYWRCAGKLTQERAVGPDGFFKIVNNKVDEILVEPPGGGSTSWRFELHAVLDGGKASGTFRMNINNLGCDTYVLKFAGQAK